MIKRTPLKRKTPLNRGKKALKSSGKLRKVGKSPTTLIKAEIQRLLREIVMKRDGGCFLRHYRDKIEHQYLNCGPTKLNGELVLQAEHLHSRTNAISFSDSRLVVCCCQRHHFYYKKQYPAQYEQFARDFIGKQRAELLDRVRTYHRPVKVDLKLEKLALEQELEKLSTV